MNYDLHIINPFQTLHGLIALWEKTFDVVKPQKVKEEMEIKLLNAHKTEVLFLHNMVMVSFAIFYERYHQEPRWEEYNKLIPYINDNAISEAGVIISC